MTDRNPTEITTEDVTASAHALAASIVTVLDILAAQRPSEFLRRDTWRVGQMQLLKVAARQEPKKFRQVFKRLAGRADYRHLPVASEPFFLAVRTGILTPEAAVGLLDVVLSRSAPPVDRHPPDDGAQGGG